MHFDYHNGSDTHDQVVTIAGKAYEVPRHTSLVLPDVPPGTPIRVDSDELSASGTTYERIEGRQLSVRWDPEPSVPAGIGPSDKPARGGRGKAEPEANAQTLAGAP